MIKLTTNHGVIGIELNTDYCEIIRRRMAGLEMNLFQIQ